MGGLLSAAVNLHHACRSVLSLPCLFAGAVCYPKVSGGKSAKAVKKCPDGFSLEKDAAGKDM